MNDNGNLIPVIEITGIQQNDSPDIHDALPVINVGDVAGLRQITK